VQLPDTGDFSELDVELYHRGEAIGSYCYHIPENETNLVMVADFGGYGEVTYYFEVE